MSMRKIIEGAAKDGSEMAEDVFQLEAEPQEAKEQAEGDREGDQFEDNRHLPTVLTPELLRYCSRNSCRNSRPCRYYSRIGIR